MKNIKTFETWKNNIIDDNLFNSGKAKYDPTVFGGIIKYKSGKSTPYYFARIQKKGNFFICKIFKKTKDGESIRLRNKKKDDLKSAHNYVREFINQRLKRDEEKVDSDDAFFEPKKNHNNIDNDRLFTDDYNDNNQVEPYISPIMEEPKRKTIIRRF
jgi:hypothetical protein